MKSGVVEDTRESHPKAEAASRTMASAKVYLSAKMAGLTWSEQTYFGLVGRWPASSALRLRKRECVQTQYALLLAIQLDTGSQQQQGQ